MISEVTSNLSLGFSGSVLLAEEVIFSFLSSLLKVIIKYWWSVRKIVS